MSVEAVNLEVLKRIAEQNTTTAKEYDKAESGIEELEKSILGYVNLLNFELMNPDNSTTTHTINYKDLRASVIKVIDSLPESDSKVPQEFTKAIINELDPYFKKSEHIGALRVVARKHQYGSSLHLSIPHNDLGFSLNINSTNPHLVNLTSSEELFLDPARRLFDSEEILPADKGIAMGIFTQAVHGTITRE